jgi:fructokinase
MTHSIGLDIGGTKIAGAFLSDDGALSTPHRCTTPQDYALFLQACVAIVRAVADEAGGLSPIGIGLPGAPDTTLGTVNASNLPFLAGQPFQHDLEARLGVPVLLANDANCMALAEAVDGAGQGASNVLGLIVGTGVGSGWIVNGRIVAGANGMAGEIGHLPLPFREASDGPVYKCGCQQTGCIEQAISGPGLERLYTFMTGEKLAPPDIARQAAAGEAKAVAVLDRYADSFAKAMITVLHSFDPDIVVIAGGMKELPVFYDALPARMAKYTFAATINTRFVPARFGPESGLHGAARLSQTSRA